MLGKLLGLFRPNLSRNLASFRDVQSDLARLETISPGNFVARIGKGNLITIVDERSDGTRHIRINKKAGRGALASASYAKFPGYLTVLHQGSGPADAVSITFDDGPDAKWTPQILDILKAKGVHATFFMIGANMEKHPKIVNRIVREGHYYLGDVMEAEDFGTYPLFVNLMNQLCI